MLQYKQSTLDINDKLLQYSNEFIDISDVIQKIITPPPANGPFTKEFIYFGARNVFLPDISNQEVSLYSISYLGNAKFAHSRQAFDAFINHSMLSAPGEIAQLDNPAGLLTEFIEGNKITELEFAYAGSYKHFRPFCFNTGDFDRDGKHDFILGKKLLLSSHNYNPMKGFDLPQESIFVETHEETILLSLSNNILSVSQYNGSEPVEICRTTVSSIIYADIPHVLLPLPLNKNHPPIFAIRSNRGLDIYTLNKKKFPKLKWWISELVEKEVLIGAFGEFIGNNYVDFWVSQVATGIERGACADQVLLISSEKLLKAPPGEIPLEAILYFTVKGCDTYSDYDGISTSLSPIAGDINGDGKPDLTFVGHRHMNEAGALYILLNKEIKKGGVIDITNKAIIKVLGKAMSQLAPPYVHWDATDLTGSGYYNIIVAADNDLYSGLHAGAIYVLDSKKILDLWHTKNSYKHLPTISSQTCISQAKC